ncbi:MAG TPA: hypothetical protein V6C96_05495, partial [Vampirovibrionales bacterium]
EETYNYKNTTEKTIKLEEDSEVKVTLTKSVSSNSSIIGQPVEAEVLEDVVVNGRVLVKQGTTVKGFISSIQKAKRMGRGGNIGIQFNSVKAIDKQKIGLRSAMGRNGSDKTGKTVAMTVIFGLPGLLVKGKDAGIRKGTEIIAFVDDDYEIESGLVIEEQNTEDSEGFEN